MRTANWKKQLALLMAASAFALCAADVKNDVPQSILNEIQPGMAAPVIQEKLNAAFAAAKNDAGLLVKCYAAQIQYAPDKDAVKKIVSNVEKDVRLDKKALAEFYLATLFDHAGSVNELQTMLEKPDSGLPQDERLALAIRVSRELLYHYRVGGIPSQMDCLAVVKMLEAVRTDETKSIPMNILLARAHLRLGNAVSVRNCVETALKLPSPSPNELAVLKELSGDIEYQEKHFSAAYQAYGEAEKHLAGQPDRLGKLRLKRAHAAMAVGEKEQTLHALKQIDLKAIPAKDADEAAAAIGNLEKRGVK